MIARRWLSAVVYPAVTLGAGGAAVQLVRLGWSTELVIGLVFLALVVVVQVLERTLVYEAAWNVPRGDVLTDSLHFLISTVAVTVVFVAAVARWMPPTVTVWPHQWPVVLQILLALVVGELGAYALHRWMHVSSALWRLHRIHHSAERLYAANSSRNHPLDSLMVLAGFALPLVWLGAGDEVLAGVSAFALAHLTLQHSNIELRLGPLNWVLAGPELHRWHHSRSPAEGNRNYGHVLILWDVVFRSRWLPNERRPPVDVGLSPGEAVPPSFQGQLVAPFLPAPTARLDGE